MFIRSHPILVTKQFFCFAVFLIAVFCIGYTTPACNRYQAQPLKEDDSPKLLIWCVFHTV